MKKFITLTTAVIPLFFISTVPLVKINPIWGGVFVLLLLFIFEVWCMLVLTGRAMQRVAGYGLQSATYTFVQFGKMTAVWMLFFWSLMVMGITPSRIFVGMVLSHVISMVWLADNE